MVQYKRCSEIDIGLVYNAFTIGFSDYIVKINMTQQDFTNRFFGPEGNSLEHSFIALEDGAPAGLILGGIKVYEGIKTLRCGTLCIPPEYRGKGISNRLFELFKEEGIKNNCKQLFLEVIVGNDRAIKFYNKLGFEKVYDLKYFSLSNIQSLNAHFRKEIEIKEINLYEFASQAMEAVDVHINWQNDFDYIKKSEGQIFFGAAQNGKIIGSVCITKGGRLSFLWVNPEYRNKGIASSILKHAAEVLGLSKIACALPNNALLEGFLRHVGFNKDNISQYEMYLIL